MTVVRRRIPDVSMSDGDAIRRGGRPPRPADRGRLPGARAGFTDCATATLTFRFRGLRVRSLSARRGFPNVGYWQGADMGSFAKICFVQMIGPTVDIVATAADDPSPTEKTFTPGSSI